MTPEEKLLHGALSHLDKATDKLHQAADGLDAHDAPTAARFMREAAQTITVEACRIIGLLTMIERN